MELRGGALMAAVAPIGAELSILVSARSSVFLLSGLLASFHNSWTKGSAVAVMVLIHGKLPIASSLPPPRESKTLSCSGTEWAPAFQH